MFWTKTDSSITTPCLLFLRKISLSYFPTKRRLHDRKTEHFKALAKNDNTSAIADHVKATGHNIKWDLFDILAKGKTDYHCKIKETLYIQELEPAFNVNVEVKSWCFINLFLSVKYLLNLGSSPLTFVIYI